MSSYRSYTPWRSANRNSSGSSSGKNASERFSIPASSSYLSRTANYASPSSNNASSSTSTPASNYQFRKNSSPSILKKYANYGGASKSTDYRTTTSQDSDPSPRCKPFTKFASYEPAESTGLRYGSASRFGTQIARSPINEKSQTVFGVSVPSKAETITVVSRSTSPSPSSYMPDDAVKSEVLKSMNVTTRTNSTQTDEPKTDSLTSRYSKTAYNYTKPTELPVRRSYYNPVSRSPDNKSYEKTFELAIKELENRRDKSPSKYLQVPSTARTPSPTVRTPSPTFRPSSPLTVLNRSFTNLSIKKEDSSETDSSYEEDYPFDKDTNISDVQKCNAPTELPDKPPKYPLSPKLKTVIRDGKLMNVRSHSGSRINSSSEDVSENSTKLPNIPIHSSDSPYDSSSNKACAMRSESPQVNSSTEEKSGYRIRKMDSGELPWWLNSKDSTESKSENSSVSRKTDTPEIVEQPQNGYTIRKMDSAESPWWCQSDKESVTRSSPINGGYAIRKMDSADSPWWCKSGSDDAAQKSDSLNAVDVVSSNTANSYPTIRKFDSDNEWWNETSESDHKTPDWWKGDDVDNYKSKKTLRITKIVSPEITDSSDCRENQQTPEQRSEWTNGGSVENLADDVDDYRMKYINDLDNLLVYIGKYTNIDDLLGTEVPPPAAPATPSSMYSTSEEDLVHGCTRISASQVRIHDGSAHTSTIQRRNHQFVNDCDPFENPTHYPEPARPPVHTFSCTLPLGNQIGAVHRVLKAPHRLDDAALQLYKDGDYGSYLDLESSIAEQQEEFEGFQSRKDSIVVRTQLSVRVHLIIEKLMKSEGRELRRALFSLKQIFQEDKDLVHEFVQNDGLDCLIKVGSDVDQNYQNYILRALGQVMLYVDGMNGVMEHNPTIQWLYSLVSSKFRLVVKTALKLLLVFVEYVESNCTLLIQAIHSLNKSQGTLPWSNMMRLLHEYDTTDTELLIYAMTLINKTLNGIPDQDTYYDQVDLLEEQDIESVIRKYMSKQGTDLDLLRQFQIYEAVLQHEDGEDRGTPLRQLDETVRKTLRNRKSLTNGTSNSMERRKSRRHSTGTTNTLSSLTLSMARFSSDSTSPEEYKIKQAADGVGVTPGLRRRRERAERQRSLLREQYESNMRSLMSTSSSEDGLTNGIAEASRIYVPNTVNKLQHMDDGRCYYNGDVPIPPVRESSVKDITQKLAILQTPDESSKNQSVGIVGEMKGIISKAIEGLAKSQSRCDVRGATTDSSQSSRESKKTETELHWEELLASSTRALQLCDLDFSDLHSDDERDVLAPAVNAGGIPPPPPPCVAPPPAPQAKMINKGKKTVKLFWKEVREDPIVMTKLNSKNLIWDEMTPVRVDTQKLEHLFESRAKDLITKKQHELKGNKEIIVLDPKRSNAINIGMTKLPPPRSIKTAILKMDSTVMNREGIEKLLMMLPTDEERSKIQEAQSNNPELPLGSAEHFLLTLASITELTARLKLWAFKLNYENIEKEIADPLMDLKQGMDVLKDNKTFRAILSTLLSIGIFLNGSEVKGFQIEYLSKVPEVKDTVHKHSLLHHLCHMVMEKFPDSTDLYSEIGAVTRASRVDFDEVNSSILRVEGECKASFDYLKAIAKHDGNTAMKLKISEFLVDCAERIIALGKIHRRVSNRFHKFCLWLGIPLHRIQLTKPNELCKVISEFALEYRTTRERVIQQLEKKASHRERNKTRGKMITEVGKFKSKEDRQDAELRQLLGKEQAVEKNDVNTSQCGSLNWRRQRRDSGRSMLEPNSNGHLVDADDELLETLVKTATKAPASRSAPRERKRTRHSDRKSLRRTLKNGLTEEERTLLATYIKTY